MAKYYGEIGFSITSETVPGVWTEEITTRNYPGDVIRNSYRWQNSGNLNDDINISNRISIIMDQFAVENVGNMRYATYMNSKWKITDVEVEYPRLILTLGGVYNE